MANLQNKSTDTVGIDSYFYSWEEWYMTLPELKDIPEPGFCVKCGMMVEYGKSLCEYCEQEIMDSIKNKKDDRHIKNSK